MPVSPSSRFLSHRERISHTDKLIPIKKHHSVSFDTRRGPIDKNQQITQLSELFEKVRDHITGGLLVNEVFAFWAVVQVLIAVTAFLFAKWAVKHLNEPLESRLREIKDNRRTLRILAVFFRRLEFILLTLFLWIGVAALRASTWQWNSLLLTAIASLAAAWLFISIFTRLINNRAVANVVAVVVWVLAALNILGILPQALNILDSIAFELQDFRISLLVAIKATIMLVLLVWLAIVFSRFVENRINQLEDLTPSVRVLLSKTLKAAILALAILIALNAVGIPLAALAIFSGAVGLGLGFGLQKIVSNLISGILLLLDKSIKPGDVITVGDTFGSINSLSARYASVVTRDGREFLIPNEDLITQQVLNWSFSSKLVRLDIAFGVSYGADPHLVRKVAIEAAAQHARTVSINPPVCHMTGFGDSTIDFTLRFWIDDPANGITNVKGDIMLNLWDIFKVHKIEFAYPHTEIRFATPLQVTKPGESSN